MCSTSHTDRLDNLNTDDLDAIRAKRLQEMKKRQEKLIEWKRNVSIYTLNKNDYKNKNTLLFRVMVNTWN